MTAAITDFSQYSGLRAGAERNDPAVLREVAGPDVAKDVKPGGVLVADMYGLPFKLAMPRLAPAILSRIDGQTSLAEIRDDLEAEPDGFARQFTQLYDAFNGVNRMLLRVRD